MSSLPCCDFFRTDCKAGAYRGLGKCSIGCLIHEVRKYNPDEPIVIAEDNVTIKAMAVSDELSESDVVTFTYRLKQNTLGYQLDGWTWLSHNLESAVPVSEFTDNAERILSQTQELVRDSKYGLIGNLTELLPIEAYKLKLSSQTEKRLQGYAFNALDNTVLAIP